MSTDEFRVFADALEARADTVAPDTKLFARVVVAGAVPEGLLLACLCLTEGAEVTLYSPYGQELAAIREAGGITLRGDGPVGTFQIDRSSGPSIRLSGDLDASISGADLVILAGPVLRQRAAAYALGPSLSEGQTVAVAPGRSFGALETAWTLRAGGCSPGVTVLEARSLPYWIRTEKSVLWLTRTRLGTIAALPAERKAEIQGLIRFLPDALPDANTIQSSFSEASSAVELPALLLGGPAMPSGAAPIPAGAVPLKARETFRALLGEPHLRLASALCAERRAVAARWGIHDLPDDDTWISTHAGDAGGAFARPVPDAPEADTLARCAVVGSLIPLLSAAEVAGVDTPATRAAADISIAALGGALHATGRRLQAIGVLAGRIEDARRRLETIAREGLDGS